MLGKGLKLKVTAVGKGILSRGGVIIRAVIKLRSSVSRGVVCIRDKLLPGRAVYLGYISKQILFKSERTKIFKLKNVKVLLYPGGTSPPGYFYPVEFLKARLGVLLIERLNSIDKSHYVAELLLFFSFLNLNLIVYRVIEKNKAIKAIISTIFTKHSVLAS